MNEHNKQSSKLSVNDAIDVLTSIIDADLEKTSVGLVESELKSEHSVHWILKQDEGATVELIKKTCRIILSHLRDFYQKEYHYTYDSHALEEIRVIMNLVGDAVKKVDRYLQLFRNVQANSLLESKEYQKLQAFYQNHVARKIDDEILDKWIHGLTQKFQEISPVGSEIKLVGTTNHQTKYVFIDLESVKKDTEYELFMLKKEDGTRFFSPRLIRNIQLVSDCGLYHGEDDEPENPVDAIFYHDRMAYGCASKIVAETHEYIDQFYTEALNSTDTHLTAPFNKALIALMLAANSRNLSHQMPIKNCFDYFHDFQMFLRGCLHGNEYQHAITFPNEHPTRLVTTMVNAMQAICKVIYENLNGFLDIKLPIHGVLQHAHTSQQGMSQENHEVHSLWNTWSKEYTSVSKYLKVFPNGPLRKILENMESGAYNEFDPYIQQNVPSQLYDLYVQENKYSFVRLPSPTYQEYVDKAETIEEFIAFLESCKHDQQKCLVFNFQDRTIWKDYCRCEVLETLAEKKSLQDVLSVTTISKDTEFYHQQTPYHEENHFDVFIRSFKDQLMDENGGFFFPAEIKKLLMHDFVDEALQAVRRVFFCDKNVLSYQQRLDFIEIFYLFLQLKVIDLIQPNVIGLTCKDAIDTTMTDATLLFTFLKLINKPSLSESDREYCEFMLYGPSLVIRERVLLPERFNRMISALKVIETTNQQLGHDNFVKLIRTAFGDFYDTPILTGNVVARHQIS